MGEWASGWASGFVIQVLKSKIRVKKLTAASKQHLPVAKQEWPGQTMDLTASVRAILASILT